MMSGVSGRGFQFLLIGVLATTCGAVDLDLSKLPPAAPGKVDFARDVRPILATTCFSCHGPEKQKSNYRLDVRAHALKGGDIGRPIVPWDSAHSPLIQYVSGVHPDV